MLRHTIFASMIALAAAAGVAQAEGIPTLRGAGNDAVLEYSGGLPGTRVGGGQVSMTGHGREGSASYGTVNTIPGRVGRLQGAGDNAQVIYEPERPAPTGMARRAAGGVRG
jgi:hypothetical protein